MRVLFFIIRIVGGLAVVAAITTQLVNNVVYWKQLGITDLSSLPVNFFSFFTIESNVATVFVFLVSAVLLARKMDDPKWFGIVRACTTAFMTVTFFAQARSLAAAHSLSLSLSLSCCLHNASPKSGCSSSARSTRCMRVSTPS